MWPCYEKLTKLYSDATIARGDMMKAYKEFIDFHCPRWKELPTMDLYMEQVVTLLNDTLPLFCTSGQGKTITSTMINNYVKHGIVEAPVRKRYKKEHVAYLIVVCILKSVFSLDEISRLIHIQIARYPQERAYDYFCAELESCLSCVFQRQRVQHVPSEDEGVEQVDLIRSTIQTVAYTVYVREMLRVRTEPQTEE